MIRCSLLFAVLGAVVAPSAAVAEDIGTLPNGAVLEWPRLFIRDANGDLVEPPDSEALRSRLNLASCVCSQVSSDADTNLYYELHLSATTNMNLPAEVMTGTECDDDIQQTTNCTKLPELAIGDIDVLSTREDTISVPLYNLINARADQVDLPCVEANGGNAFVWVVVDTDQNSDPDFFSPRPIDLGIFPDVIGFDTKAPPLPDNISASGGEGSIEITWDIPEANATDLYAFQAFCMDASGAPVGSVGTPLYSTTDTVCGIPQPLDLIASPINNDEGTEVTVPPTEFSNLDPSFLCATQESGTATSLRIDGLENNMPYTIALVAVDFYGNPTGTFLSRTIVPKPVIDFWEDIHDRGGQIEGGLCATNGGDAVPGLLVPFALVWLLRRKRRLAPLGVNPPNAKKPYAAHADHITPYWEDPSNTTESGAEIYEDNVKWRAGIKLGPYTPAIDDQLGTNMTTGIGPYAAMFGNYYTDEDGDGTPEAHDAHVYQFLPMLDVDRVVWSRAGQVTVGGSLGYMQKSAFAYQDGTSADEIFRLRSTASRNTFRLIPFALTASYRATQLDDLYGIPLVPYVRGGLAYYVWWMKGPSGSLSRIEDNKAYGGTLGFQGTLGLSIRAERIDADAARSMRQTGLYHAGFYAEVMAAVVNGFGSDTKLSVGDRTWFAGFDFEF